MKVKTIIQVLVVGLLTAAGAFFLLYQSPVDITPPTQAEVDAAMRLLRDSLPNPRFGYMDFLDEHAGLRGVTPSFNQSVSEDRILDGGETVTFTFDVPHEGLYYLVLTYSLPQTFNDIIVEVTVNGERPFEEASSVVLPVFWRDETKDFPLNRFGDETVPPQVQKYGRHSVELFDKAYISDQPLLFRLQAGENTIGIHNATSRMVWVHELTVRSERVLPAYRPPSSPAHTGLITLNAIDNTHKNSPFVQLAGTRNAALYPFHPVDRRINNLNISNAGSEVFFTLDVPQDGYYAFTLHAVTQHDDMPTFITVRVNGEIPFAEAASFPLMPYRDQRWRNHTLTDGGGEPLYFYLTAGTNEISVRTELAPYAEQFRQMRLLIDHINHFSLEIRRVTGREIDRNRTWRFTRYIPETEDYLLAYHTIFRDMVGRLSTHSPRGNNSGVANHMIGAVALLDTLLERPDELPLRLSALNGTGVEVEASILHLAGMAMDNLVDVGASVNHIYVGRAFDLPRERAPMRETLWAGVQHLLATYTSDKFLVRNRDDALNVWLNYSYLHVDILQRMVDTRFTPATGIEVNLSVMPDVYRLIMARAAGTNPDVALGVPAHMPFEMGARGALHDLTMFDDFWRFMGNLVPGAMVPYIFNDSVFAIPETITFAATVYRTDILHSLGIPVPDTWMDVAAMQAELQRFDMSFYKPVASGIGYKWFFQTSPLIYQHGGLLFNPDGLSTAINEPDAVRAITFLGDLFSTFALDAQVPALFNAFRFGQNPVAILDPATYMLLINAAPELLGQWNIAPFPGTLQDDGSIARWFIANGNGSMIFNNTERADEAWEFIKWYLSAEIQRDLAFSLFANHNILWLSANLEALAEVPIESHHREVLLESMKWLRDVPRSPGQYILERMLSDIWNTMVMDGTPAQAAIDLRVIEINREFTRKMTEFGFLDANGNQIRPYVVRELDWVIAQIEGARP
ncbi:MAG: extracellular solute-binding protein [Defluviitaleaceae bacterium]|nr:extracellular solute-binding protein [Defluviitaleaceae bacterium]